MTIFLFLLALVKCITLMGSKTNVVCCSVPYITLIIGKRSLVHKKQKKLYLENTNFINSSGWPVDDHYSTVRDIGILSNELIKNFPNLYSYFSEKSFTYNDIKQFNRNKLIYKSSQLSTTSVVKLTC